jgi:hypothetical protein
LRGEVGLRSNPGEGDYPRTLSSEFAEAAAHPNPLPASRGARERTFIAAPFSGNHLTSLSAPSRPARTFPDECCFQVIYFVSSIFFLTPVELSPKARVETCWLTDAVKNIWATRRFAGFCAGFVGPAGLTERKWRD